MIDPSLRTKDHRKEVHSYQSAASKIHSQSVLGTASIILIHTHILPSSFSVSSSFKSPEQQNTHSA